MAPPEAILALDLELRALPAGERRRILQTLSDMERARLAQLLQPVAELIEVDTVIQPPRLSGWLEKRLREAGQPADAAEGTQPMTAATRRSLVHAIDRAYPKQNHEVGTPARASLLGLVAARIAGWGRGR